MRIGVGYLLQKTNTFSPVETQLEDFGLVKGNKVVDRWHGTKTEIGGFFDVLEGAGQEAVPLFAGWAMTAGRLSAETFKRLVLMIGKQLEKSQPLDALLLALHGSMSANGTDDCDGQIIEVARKSVQNKPLVVTLDFQANLTAKMVHFASSLVSYQTYPFTDMYSTGVSAAELLLRSISREIILVSSFKKLPLMISAENTQATNGPMKQVFDIGHKNQNRGEVLSISAFGVQPWLDVEEMGCATLAVSNGNFEHAEQCASEMARCLWGLRKEFTLPLKRPREAIRLAANEPCGPVILAEISDAPSAGAPGDSAELLLPLEQYAPDHKALIWIRDPMVVHQAVKAGVGGKLRSAIGGVFDKVNRTPVLLDGVVRSISNGTFRFSGRYNTGMWNNMGATAVMDSGKITLVVTERPANMTSPDVYLSQGINPCDYHIVVVKCINSFRCEYEFSSRVILVDTPGIASSNLLGLLFEHVPRPIYPLDQI